MPRPSGIIGRVSRPDMPVCGQFQVRRALEIQDKFTGAATHTPRPSRVKTGKPQSEQMFSGLPPKADLAVIAHLSRATAPARRASARSARSAMPPDCAQCPRAKLLRTRSAPAGRLVAGTGWRAARAPDCGHCRWAAYAATEIPNETACSALCFIAHSEVTEWEQKEYFELF
jgi:hypothetical protein